ncbi:MAG: acyltransferase [Nostocales cyanobacterium]|nr:MAG: acyltransferase [Nostocales cyanobacterium]TAF16749.1 MAG: acyltransferase [Nostocales cyanobacterium]
MKDTNRLIEIDALRGIAALAIVFFHYASSYKWADYHLYGYFRYLEEFVQIFFIISGFVILISINRLKRSLDFIIGRLARLYPMYLFSVITTVLITNVMGMATPRTENIYDIIRNCFLVQGFLGGESVNIVYWTLVLEIFFYIIMLTIYKLKAAKYIDIICGVWILIIVLNAVKAQLSIASNIFNIDYPTQIGVVVSPELLMLNISSFASSFKDSIKNNYILLQGRAMLFIAGIMLYQIKMQGGKWYRWVIIALCVTAKVLDYSSDAQIYSSVFFIVFLLLMYLATIGKLEILAIKPFLFLGSISYALYLTHLQIGWLFKSTFDIFPPEIAILIRASLAVVAASLLTSFIEIPGMNLIKSQYKKLMTAKVTSS